MAKSVMGLIFYGLTQTWRRLRFYRSLCKYNEEHDVDLFKECFQKITKAQTKES